MIKPTVHITKRVQTDAGWRYYPAVEAANGRLKADAVLVDGAERKFDSGTYCLEWREGGRRIRKSIGPDPTEALFAKGRKEAELAAIAAGIVVQPQQGSADSLAASIKKFLSERENKPGTHSAYETALDYFQQSCKAPTAAHVTRDDLVAFVKYLRNVKTPRGKLSARTIFNKANAVSIFLKAVGHPVKLQRGDRPKFTESDVETYEPEELTALWEACRTDDEKLLFQFFLQSGFRDQEVQHATYSDINFHAGTIAVREKPEYNWEPKTYAAREVPLPEPLLAALRERKKHAKNALIFPGRDGKPRINFYRALQLVVSRDESLNADNFWLHKFRSTFATTHLDNGISVVTVQAWMGHKDLASTMRYLRAARGPQVREKVNSAFAALV